MDYKERKNTTEQVTADIIAMQYYYRKKYGFENHFLLHVIHKMMSDQSPQFMDVIDYVIENNGGGIDDGHDLRMTMHLNNKKKVVFSIYDDTIYGPNINHILVIKDIENCTVHIRKLQNKSEIKEYQKNKWEVFGESFTSRGYIYTYEYMSKHWYEDSLEEAKTNPERAAKFLEVAKKQTKLQETNDNTLHLYECFVYVTGLIFSIKNTIDYRKND